MTNGRDKGRRGELEVATLIKAWWGNHNHEPNATFIRTPLSGGWQYNTNAAAHFNACGDIMTTAKTFPYCVEVKWRESWSVNNFLDGKPTPPWAWWRQTIVAADKQNSVPMMWMRRNRLAGTREQFPWIVLLPESYADGMVLDAPDIRWDHTALLRREIDVSGVLPCGYVAHKFLAMKAERLSTLNPNYVKVIQCESDKRRDRAL